MKAIIWCVTGVHMCFAISVCCGISCPNSYTSCNITVIPNSANGFYFVHAVCITVCMDHDEEMTLGKLQSSILGHMAANVNYYKQFHYRKCVEESENILQIWYTFWQCCWSNCCCHGKSSKHEPQNISKRVNGKHTNSWTYYTCNSQRSPSWNLYMTLVMWVTTTMKPYCSLMNLYTKAYIWRGYHRESLSQHCWAANMPRWCRWCDWPYGWLWGDNLWTVRLTSK